MNIPFPRTLRSMQSFLGSLNYYSRFIEDFATDASALYQLREADVFEISRQRSLDGSALKVETEQDPGSAGGSIEVVDQVLNTGNEVDSEGITRWEKAMIAFTMLKAKIAGTPILNHFDPERPPVIVVYASKWAVSAALSRWRTLAGYFYKLHVETKRDQLRHGR